MVGAVILVGALAWVGGARAEPALQLYLEGATYDRVTESWVKTFSSSGSDSIRLWAIGATGNYGSILDVKLAVAYDVAYDMDYGVNKEVGGVVHQLLDIQLTPSTTGGMLGFADPSTADLISVDAPNKHEVGTVPILNDGKELPAHGEYGEGIAWQEFRLGDFNLVDSPIVDFVAAPGTNVLAQAPDPPNHIGQISAYEVNVVAALDFEPGDSFHGLTLHFDLYNHVQTGRKSKSRFAPFSHDTHAEADFVPEPGSLIALVGMAPLVLAGLAWTRRRRRAK